MMRLERLADVTGGASGAGVVAAGGRIVGRTEAIAATSASFTGRLTDNGVEAVALIGSGATGLASAAGNGAGMEGTLGNGAGDVALMGSGPDDMAPMAGAVAGMEGVLGSGGWKRRADLRRSGSTGGVMALDFRRASGPDDIVAGLTSVGGNAMEADFRMIGSTGGTRGVDFFTKSGGGTAGALKTGAIGASGVMAAVLAGIMGSDAVAEVMPGAITPDRRTKGAMTGFIVGLMEGVVIEAGAAGGGIVGMADGVEGARMGDDFATGRGMLGAAAGTSPTGGVTVLVGARGFGNDSEAGRTSDDVIGRAPVSTAWPGRGGGVETSGGCGASGSGTRAVLVSVTGEAGSGGMGVRAVSLSGGGDDRRAAIASGVMVGSVPVAGSAGGRLPCSTGARSPSNSVLPLLRKTLAWGLAMITRGGASGTGTRPVAVGTRPVLVGTRPAPTGSGGGRLGGGSGGCSAGRLEGTRPVRGGAKVGPGPARSMEVLEPVSELVGGAAGRGLSGVGSTSGSVFAREPVSEADCLSCERAGETRPVGGRVGFCIGCVTAVDHVGVTPCDTPGFSLSDAFSGMVAAVPELARAN
jgi:hypothetical protein